MAEVKTPDEVREQIEQWAAILAMLLTPGAAAAVLKVIAAELIDLQPRDN